MRFRLTDAELTSVRHQSGQTRVTTYGFRVRPSSHFSTNWAFRRGADSDGRAATR